MVNQKSCCWNPRFWPPQFNSARSQKDPQFPLTIKLKSRFAQGSSNPRTEPEPESNSSSLVRSRSPPEFKKELATNRLRGLRCFKKHVQFGFHGCLQRYRCESEPHGSRLRLQPAQNSTGSDPLTHECIWQRSVIQRVGSTDSWQSSAP